MRVRLTWPKRSLPSTVKHRCEVARERSAAGGTGLLHALCWLVRSVSCDARSAWVGVGVGLGLG